MAATCAPPRATGWSVASSLLDEHLRHCVANAARTEGADAQLRVADATEAIARLVRS